MTPSTARWTYISGIQLSFVQHCRFSGVHHIMNEAYSTFIDYHDFQDLFTTNKQMTLVDDVVDRLKFAISCKIISHATATTTCFAAAVIPSTIDNLPIFISTDNRPVPTLQHWKMLKLYLITSIPLVVAMPLLHSASICYTSRITLCS